MTAPDCAALTAENIVAFIADIFEHRGAREYLGEPVSVAEHMLQGATIAEQNGEDDGVIVAVLLHDIGHLTGASGGCEMADGQDRHHEISGATVLAAFLPALVVDCVRHHVTAKRYLCATEPGYAKCLSDASVHSLKLQGGPLNPEQIEAFENNPHLREILQVRRLDDAGKHPGMKTPPFAHFAPMVQRLVDSHGSARGA